MIHTGVPSAAPCTDSARCVVQLNVAMLLRPVHHVAAAVREASVLGLLRHPHIVPYKVNLRNLCNLSHCKVCCWVMAVDQVLSV